jgi:hypothetical protein
MKITITGTNRSGSNHTEPLGDDAKNAYIHDDLNFGDGTVFEELEYVDAAEKQYEPRGQMSRPISWTTTRSHVTPQGALRFIAEHRWRTPLKGTLKFEETGLVLTIPNVCLRIANMVPIGSSTITFYEAMGGDFAGIT